MAKQLVKNNPDKLHNIRHSLAHLLAAAVQEMFPKAQMGVGPVIENGFYYDFLLPRPLTPDDLKKLEKRMRELARKKLEFKREELQPEAAIAYFSEHNQPFKVELIHDLQKFGTTSAEAILNSDEQMQKVSAGENLAGKNSRVESVSLYHTGNFVDLCRGGHVNNTSEIETGSFKLERVSGAYWRGDQTKPQMQRVYGLAFENKNELDAYITLQEELEKRDHKKLGPQLELFMFHHTSPGMPYWLPKGVILYNELIHFWRDEHTARGYQEIVSPILNKKELYITSGHFEHYWNDMFVTDMGKDEEYGVKPMNCPNAMIVFGYKQRSYRELPLRLSDTDPLHRFELSGALNGLFRVRQFRQDDAHIFITEEQIESEHKEIFKIVKRFYSVFGLKYRFRLGTRPESFTGDIETWNKAETILKKVLKDSGIEYFIEEGDGAFYGPKIDILMKDILGRDWQMGTIQLDFQQPRRFELEYIAKDGSRKTPVAIHRVIYGSLERFIGILIEHTAGAFPTWLSPIQVAVLPISQAQTKQARDVKKQLKELLPSVRIEVDDRDESVGKKIRETEMKKIPYMLIIGEKEKKSGKVSVRGRGQKEYGTMTVKKFAAMIADEIATPKI